MELLKSLLEPLIIIFVVLIVYWRTFDFKTIIDDVKRFASIRKGLFFRPRPWLEQVKNRLYSGGTFVIAKPCKECKGTGKIPKPKTKEVVDDTCPNCYGHGKYHDLNYKVEHIATTLIHALICVLIYFAFGKNETAFMASCLYAVNPANNQSSVWLNGRRYAFNIVIVLLMLIIGPLGMLLYPMTAILQVSAILAPLMYGEYLTLPIAGMCLLAIAVFVFLSWEDIKEKILWRWKLMPECDHKKLHIAKLIPTTKVYGAYILKMIFPERTLMTYPFLYYWALTKEGDKNAYRIDRHFIWGIVCVAFSVAGLKFFEGQTWWLFLFMCLSIVQWCGFITLNQIFADRYIPLPNVFMMMFVSWFTVHYGGDFKYAIFFGMFIYYMQNLNITFMMYKDVESFWNYHAYYNPQDSRIAEWRATYLLSVKDISGAWEICRTALANNPTDMKLNMMAAKCMRLSDDTATFYYMGMAKKHCYIGRMDDMYKGFQREIFGFDIDEEYEKINNKTSRMLPKQRESVKDMWHAINDNPNVWGGEA